MGLGFEGLKGDKGQKGESGPPGSTAPIMPFQGGTTDVTGPQGDPGYRGDKVCRKILSIFLYIITCRNLYYILIGVTYLG